MAAFRLTYLVSNNHSCRQNFYAVGLMISRVFGM